MTFKEARLWKLRAETAEALVEEMEQQRLKESYILNKILSPRHIPLVSPLEDWRPSLQELFDYDQSS